jgi:hypothetical protein
MEVKMYDKYKTKAMSNNVDKVYKCVATWPKCILVVALECIVDLSKKDALISVCTQPSSIS